MSDAGQVAELDDVPGALVGAGVDGGADFDADVGEGVGQYAGGGDGVGADGLEEAVAVFTRVRPRLFGMAYRTLSSVTEAEDLVQEVWVRWQTCDRKAVRDPAAFLATTAIRLAINELRSARVRREKCVFGGRSTLGRGCPSLSRPVLIRILVPSVVTPCSSRLCC